MEFVQQNLTTILTVIILAFAWWRGGFEKFNLALEKSADWYDRMRKDAEERHFYDILKKAYDFTNDKARILAKKTENTTDDAVIDKLAVGMEWALKALKLAGLESKADEDVIAGYFGHLNEAENRAKDLAGNLPGAPISGAS